MSYNEAQDLDEHKADIDRLFAALTTANMALRSDALVLDVGGGAGMHSAMLTPHAKRVICTDFFDQNTRFNGEFVKLLREKMQRNGREFFVDRFEFHAADATNMIYRDDAFDAVVSFNAFEHIPDPEVALREMLRVIRPGGFLYLTFDPIWTCDSGSHFMHRVPQPWQHLLVDDDEFCRAILAAGGDVNETNEYRTAMNRRRLGYYRDVFNRVRVQARLVVEREWSGCTNPENERHENFAKCIAKGYGKDELLFRGMQKILRKPGA